MAPVLSNLFLGHLDRCLADRLEGLHVIKIFRYVDDFLVLFDSTVAKFPEAVDKLLTVFRQCFNPLELTHEVPVNNALQFLDISLTLSEQHVCWSYHPRANKPLLPFHSAHSKLTKRGIASMCFKNALSRSCCHTIQTSFKEQSERLLAAGYPAAVLVSVAEGSLKNLNAEKCQSENTEKKKVAVIPYLHNTSHRLKKIASRINVKVVLSAPNKMNQLCKMTNPYRKRPAMCEKQHRTPFVQCAVGVVYEVPLSCGRQYIGQTGRCLNDRLREHRLNVSNHRDGHLSVHCHDCGCVPLFESCVVRARHREQLVREIMEAEMIIRAGSTCVSVASLNLTDKESAFLGKAATRGR